MSDKKNIINLLSAEFPIALQVLNFFMSATWICQVHGYAKN